MIGFRWLAGALAALALTTPGLAQEAQPRRIAEPQWLSQPLADDFAWAYPQEALAAKVDGHVLLDCAINEAGRLYDCRATLEAPEGRGFGQAARNVAGLYRIAQATPDGVPTAGARVDVPVRFDWRGRAGDPRIAGAPEPRPDASPKWGKTPSPLTLLLGFVACIGGWIFLVARDWAQRDRRVLIGAALAEGWRFLPSYVRRAPLPVGMVALAGLFAFPLGPMGEFGRMGFNLLLSVFALFAVAAAYRLYYQDRGRRFPPAPGLGGLTFGSVEGAVWMAGLAAGALLLLIGVILALVIFGLVRLDIPKAGPVIGVVGGLAVAGFFVLAARLSFVAPLAALTGSVDLRGAWDFGLGRVGAVYAVSFVTSLLIGPVAMVAMVVSFLTHAWWLGGLGFGLGYAVYYGFLSATLAALVMQGQASPPTAGAEPVTT